MQRLGPQEEDGEFIGARRDELHVELCGSPTVGTRDFARGER